MFRLTLALALAALPAAGAAFAQYAPPSVTTAPPPTYGYQPPDPGNPTGFNHPDEQGFGAYRNPTKLKGHRSETMSHRRFRGY